MINGLLLGVIVGGSIYFCRLLLAGKNHIYTVLMIFLGFFLILWGMGDASLSESISLEEMLLHKRSRAVLVGLACILGSVCHWLADSRI